MGATAILALYYVLRRHYMGVPRLISNKELRDKENWVSICGHVFDTSSKPGLVGKDGMFGRIGGHDATLIFAGRIHDFINQDNTRNVEGDIEAALDKEVDKDTLSAAEEAVLVTWFNTFQLQFPIVGRMADMYRDPKWNSVRNPDKDGKLSSCPLGFGVKRPQPVTLRPCLTPNGPWIIFNGTRYDVSNAALFEPTSPFHVYIGHDITYALAIGSVDPKDFDQPLTPDTNLTYAQQKLLAQYQNAFSSTLAVIAS
ncbi:hypothetical protein THRCLA_08004 [Thraustotheca clavata]|uniref:Cytochrome b5 heme-binding domain-containing protein n=1 Tax=Thraustotheca clavata TaxID=74557 RepID=A0A1V9ZAZ5_9STRA|nr:hypothetical protein THRCLA_08004 [Thraustotheca clavata]